MNISYSWLKNYINIDNKTPQQVADDLTSIGLEVDGVEEIESIKGRLKGLVIGEVLTCEPHPDSDHMHVTTVDIGEAEPIQVVCGAPNVAAGQKVVVATIGTILYDGDQSFKIKKSKLRGIESYGMLCAEDEIGIGTDHAGIIVLPADTKIGTPAAEYYNIKSEAVIEVDITPNRSDAVSHYGCARDLAARYSISEPNIKLNKPTVDNFKVDDNSYKIDIDLKDSTAAPRYSGITVSDVTVKESPEWLKNAIESVGLRSINNIVDVSNYVLYALGQPIHTFDADKISGGKVIVRKADEGTQFTTLDGVERKLSGDDIVICNDKKPMCLAGVFGGLESGVTTATKNIFIESAYFNPVLIRKTARRHGLQTDASFRYERGCDPNNTIFVLKFSAMLIKEVAGGRISSEIKDVYPNEIKPAIVDLKYSYVDSLIGQHIDKKDIKTILNALEIKTLNETDEGLRLEVPTYRVDVTRPADVVEDILRIYGYDKVELTTAVHSSLSFSPNPNPHKLQTLVSNMLTDCGFNEIMNNSLTKSSYYAGLKSMPLDNCVKLMNPLSQDLSVMRQTLLFGGLESIARNRNYKALNLKFYEYGNCYYHHPERHHDNVVLSSYSEDNHLALWICGNKGPQSWVRKEEKTSIYELKAYVENTLRKIGLPQFGWEQGKESDIYSNSLTLKTNNKVVGSIGIVKTEILNKMDIDTEVFYADINWTSLLKTAKGHKVLFSEISKFPEVKRDLALLVDQNVKFSDIVKIAQEQEKKLLKSVTLFDVYQGKNLEANQKSYAVTFILQDEEKTLKDTQIDAIMQKIQKALEDKLNAKLR